MQEVEYLYYLTAELTDRLRVFAQKEKGMILQFVVQYEALMSGKWQPVVRYDTAHGFAHKDVMTATGKTIKQPLFFETYNLTFTHATLDLKANCGNPSLREKNYRRDFEGGHKE